MDTDPLTLFARKVSTSGRLLFADLRRLQRDILPNGIATREEAEILLSLDQVSPYLIEAVSAFVVSSSELEDRGAWLAQAHTTAQPRTAAALVWPLAREWVT